MGSRVSIHVVVVIEFYELIFATVGLAVKHEKKHQRSIKPGPMKNEK